MAQKEKKPIFKRWWFWAIIVVVILIAAGSSSSKNSNTQTVSGSGSAATQNAAATATPAETITITHSVYKPNSYGSYEVDGDATNNDSVEHTASLKATFYDASGNIMGTAAGVVGQLAPGQTKTFTLGGTDKVTGYATMKVQVDALL